MEQYFKKKNKKGFLPVIGFIVIGVIVLMSFLFVAGLLNFLKNNLFMILGILLFVGGVIFAIKSQGSTQFKTTIILILLGVGAIFVLGGGVLQEQLGTQTYPGLIEIPTFCTIQCDEDIGDPINGPIISIPTGGVWASCPKGSRDCDVKVSFDKPTKNVNRLRRIQYYTCDSIGVGCNNPTYYPQPKGSSYPNGIKDFIIPIDLDAAQVMYIQLQEPKLFSSQWIETTITGSYITRYLPFILWSDSETGGGLNPIPQSQDCKYRSTDEWTKKGIITADVKDKTGKNAITIPAKTGELDFKETYNYVCGTVTSAEFGNTVSYNNQQAYCAENIAGVGAVMYDFGLITTNDITYKVVDTNTIIAQSPQIECCQNGKIILNKICKDFKLVDQTPLTISECDLFNPCTPGTLQYSDTQTFEYKCIDNQCKETNIKTVECTEDTQNSVCGVNEICVNFNCQQASTIFIDTSSGSKIIEKDGNGGEKECSSFEEPVEVNSEYKKGIFSIFGVGKTVTETQVVCKTKDTVKWIIMGAIVLGLGLTAILVNRPRRRQSRRGRRR